MTLDLYLVRHAVAFERDPLRWPDDAARPLTPAGEASFRRAARGAHKMGLRAERVLTSPLERAAHTAAILREEAAWPAAETMVELSPDVSPEVILKALHERGADAGAVALVGHEPSLSTLARELLNGARIEMKKGAIARLELKVLRPGAARLRALLPPKALRAAGR